MGQTLAIAEHDLRLGSQFAQGREHARKLAEAEQAGNVGQPTGDTGQALFDDGAGPSVPKDNAGDDLCAVARKRNVRTGEQVSVA